MSRAPFSGKSILAALAAAALCAGLSCCDSREDLIARVPEGLSLRGVNLQPYTWTDRESYGSEASRTTDGELRELGANAIGIRQYVKVPRFDSDTVTEDRVRGVSEDLIRREIRQQKALGLHPLFTLGTALVDGRMELEPGATARNGAPSPIAAPTRPVSGEDCPPSGGWLAWHGTIDLDSPEAYDRFFAAYEAVLLRYARVAQEEGADVLSLGNELVSLTSTRKLRDLDGDYQYRLFRAADPAAQAYATATVRHLARFKSLVRPESGDEQRVERLVAWLLDVHARVRDGTTRTDQVSLDELPEKRFLLDAENTRRGYLERKWRSLIADVRRAFHGALILNANFDNFEAVGFWDALDAIGINAYFRLTPQDPATGLPLARDMSLEELHQAWISSSQEIGNFVEGLRHKRKVIFTELGFTNKRFSTSLPWAYEGCQSIVLPGQGPRRVNFGHREYYPQERALAFQALDQAIRAGHLPWLAGIFIWDAYPKRPDITDDYALLARPDDPTRAAIQRLYGGQ